MLSQYCQEMFSPSIRRTALGILHASVVAHACRFAALTVDSGASRTRVLRCVVLSCLGTRFLFSREASMIGLASRLLCLQILICSWIVPDSFTARFDARGFRDLENFCGPKI